MGLDTRGREEERQWGGNDWTGNRKYCEVSEGGRWEGAECFPARLYGALNRQVRLVVSGVCNCEALAEATLNGADSTVVEILGRGNGGIMVPS